jgi:hypothetical protein
VRSIVRCFASPRNDVFQTAKLHRHCERTKQSSRVGWAKALLRRAHRSRRARQGGHASLCPPCGFRRHTLSFSRRDFRLSFTNSLLPLEQRAQGKPGADCARSAVCKTVEVTHTGLTGTAGTSQLSPRNGFTAYTCSPRGSGLSCPRCRREIPDGLAPGSRRQDHTISPYAANVFVRWPCLSMILVGKPVPTFPGSCSHLTPQRPSHPAPYVS